MIAGLYITSLERLAAPACLKINQDATGMILYMRHNNRAVKYTISALDIFNAATDEQLVKLIENKIIELRDSLIIACNEST